MSKINMKMPEEFLKKVSRLADKTDVILPKVLEVGNDVVLEKVKSTCNLSLEKIQNFHPKPLVSCFLLSDLPLQNKIEKAATTKKLALQSPNLTAGVMLRLPTSSNMESIVNRQSFLKTCKKCITKAVHRCNDNETGRRD